MALTLQHDCLRGMQTRNVVSGICGNVESKLLRKRKIAVSKRNVSFPVALSLLSILLSVGCKGSSHSNVSEERQSGQERPAVDLASPSAVKGTTVKYGGESRFFAGADQYKVVFCEDEACEKPLESASVALEAKIAQEQAVVNKTNAQFEKFLYRDSSAESIDFNTRELTIEEAISLAKDPESDQLGESTLDPAGISKLENFLKKNKAKIKVSLADFYLSFGPGDASQSYIVIFNAETGWVTYVSFASYTE
jgi:hypothetical protein